MQQEATMAKGTKKAVRSPDAGARSKDAKRQLRGLERQLADVRDVEARLARQLDKARAQRAELEGLVAGLRPAGHSADQEPTGTDPGPRAYCMRERRTVSMVDPEAVVMRNGRAALAGTCPSCGARVVTTARATRTASDRRPSPEA
jgi:hypothetical protein